MAVRRITVALDSSPRAHAALAAAAGLAARLDAEIDALFVEDVTFVHLAELNLGREFVLSSGRAQPFDAEAIESWYRREAAEARRIMEALARERNIVCSFRVMRGRMAEAMEAACDLIVLAMSDQYAVVRRRPGPHAVVVYDGSPGGASALDAAAAFPEVTALLVDDKLRDEAAQRLAARGVRAAEFRTVHAATRADVYRIAGELGADFLITP